MYYSQIRVDPSDDKFVFVLGTQMYRSEDGGTTFNSNNIGQMHVDHHAMWIDPKDGRHLIVGNDGGIYVTWDRMRNMDHHNHVAIGQFYHVSVGPDRNYRVYGGLQDNSSWGGPSRVRNAGGPGNTDWFQLGGGDGFLAIPDPNDKDQIYYESQNGAMGRVNLRTGEQASIRPQPQQGQQFRWNWKTPFMLSPHNSQIFYSAGNYVFRSVFKGNDMRAISPEITTDRQGAGSAITESPREEGVLFVGTTDGNVWVTRNGGAEWVNVLTNPEGMPAATRGARGGRGGRGRGAGGRGGRGGRGGQAAEQAGERGTPAEGAAQQPAEQAAEQPAGQTPIGQQQVAEVAAAVQSGDGAARALRDLIPGPRWVSSLEASRFANGRCYMTLDAHRSNDEEPYLFVTEDYGRTWRSLRGNLSKAAGTTHTLREDLVNENVLYLGCEFSAWVSIDRGRNWTKFNNNLPTVAVHEFALHPTMGEIVAGTHGRSLWIADVTHIRQMTPETITADAHLYRPNTVVQWRRERSRGSAGTRQFIGESAPNGAQIYYSLGKDAQSVELTVSNIMGETLYRTNGETEAGLHRVTWNLSRQAAGGARGGRGGAAGRGGAGGGRGARGGAAAEAQAGEGEQVAAEGARGEAGGGRGGRGEAAGGRGARGQAAAGRGGGGGGGGGRGGRGGRGGGGPASPAGTYLVTLTVDGNVYKQPLTIEADPDYGPTGPGVEVEFLGDIEAHQAEEETVTDGNAAGR
jgi:hypothetical protein